jgi:hypothetical protein
MIKIELKGVAKVTSTESVIGGAPTMRVRLNGATVF